MRTENLPYIHANIASKRTRSMNSILLGSQLYYPLNWPTFAMLIWYITVFSFWVMYTYMYNVMYYVCMIAHEPISYILLSNSSYQSGVWRFSIDVPHWNYVNFVLYHILWTPFIPMRKFKVCHSVSHDVTLKVKSPYQWCFCTIGERISNYQRTSSQPGSFTWFTFMIDKLNIKIVHYNAFPSEFSSDSWSHHNFNYFTYICLSHCLDQAVILISCT